MSFVQSLDDLRVDECSNEDLGPLPGPRCIINCNIISNLLTGEPLVGHSIDQKVHRITNIAP